MLVIFWACGITSTVGAEGANVEAAITSRLTGITLPTGALRMLDEADVTEATKELRAQAQQRGQTVLGSEVLFWTGEAWERNKAGTMLKAIKEQLERASYRVEDVQAPDNKDGLDRVLVAVSPERGFIGAWAVTTEYGALAWIELSDKKADPSPGPEPEPKSELEPAGEMPHEPVIDLMVEAAPGANEAAVYRSWPLLVQASLWHPGEAVSTTPIVVSSPAGGWTSALKIECRAEGGGTVSWPLKALANPEGALILDASTAGYTGWYLTPEQTGVLTPGVYILRAHLDTSGNTRAGEWKGKAASPPVRIRVLPEPADAGPSLAERKNLSLALLERMRGSQTRALDYVQAALAANPRSVAALSLKADLLEESNKPAEALLAVQQALKAHAETTPGIEPPFALLRQQQRIAAKLLQ